MNSSSRCKATRGASYQLPGTVCPHLWPETLTHVFFPQATQYFYRRSLCVSDALSLTPTSAWFCPGNLVDLGPSSTISILPNSILHGKGPIANCDQNPSSSGTRRVAATTLFISRCWRALPQPVPQRAWGEVTPGSFGTGGPWDASPLMTKAPLLLFAAKLLTQEAADLAARRF